MGSYITENFRLKDAGIFGDEIAIWLSARDADKKWSFLPVLLTESMMRELRDALDHELKTALEEPI